MSQINVNSIAPYSGDSINLNHVGTSAPSNGYNVASGDFSFAEGSGTTASGSYTHAEGYKTTSSGFGSHAEGLNTQATLGASHAEGSGTVASGQHSHAEGQQTTSSGPGGAHAEGTLTIASGYASHAEGGTTTAIGEFSHCGGEFVSASGFASFIHSTNSIVTGSRSAVIGGQNITGSTANTVYVPKLETAETGEGIIMKSPDGTRWKLTIANGGTVSVTLA